MTVMDSTQRASGAVLRAARRRAGLTQTELAVRAGVTQSVISAYEAGRRQPALSTLAALVEATGYELDVRLRRAPRQLRRMSGPIGRRVQQRRTALIAAAATYGVTGLRVFGSVARGQDRPDSDVDLLADLPSDVGLFALGRLRSELEAILGTAVDIIPAGDLKPDIRQRVEHELVPL
jgi:predicted nucleotidyltransferase/DNA-binding XRE family transcriptional regulator